MASPELSNGPKCSFTPYNIQLEQLHHALGDHGTSSEGRTFVSLAGARYVRDITAAQVHVADN